MSRKIVALLLITILCSATPVFATGTFGLGGGLLVPISEPETRGVGNNVSLHYTNYGKRVGFSFELFHSSYPLEKDKVIKSLGYYSMVEETSWSFSGSYAVSEADLSLMFFGNDITSEEFVPVLIGGIGYGSLKTDRNLTLIDDNTGNVLEDARDSAQDQFLTLHAGGGMMMKIRKQLHVLIAVIYHEMRTSDRPVDMQFRLGLYF